MRISRWSHSTDARDKRRRLVARDDLQVNVQAFRNFRHVRFGYARPRNALFNVTLSEILHARSQPETLLRVFYFILFFFG